MITTTTERRATCRYLRLNNEQCTAEPVDPNAKVVLCTKHLARAMELVRDGMAAVAPAAVLRPARNLRRLK